MNVITIEPANPPMAEPSAAWNKGCESYYLNFERFHNHYKEEASKEFKDWQEGWDYALASCTGGK